MSSVNERILDKLKTMDSLPSLPDVVFRVEQVAIDPDSSAKDVAAAIETDPALAARLMKVANSAYYLAGSDSQVSSVQAAVARLGFREVRKVCLAIGVMRTFLRPSKLINHGRFWNHGVTVASGARMLARRASTMRADPDAAYVGGLLHEVGAIVLDQYFPHEYEIVHRQLRGRQVAIHQIEQELLGIDHAEIGALLLERWRLPRELVDAVRYHHNPKAAEPKYRRFCQFIHLADFVCTRFSCSGPGEQYLWQVNIHAWEDLGLQLEDLRDVKGDIMEEGDRTGIFIAESMVSH